MMDVKYDPVADAAYVQLHEGKVAGGRDLDLRRRVDVGVDGQPIGIEFLGVSEGLDVSGLPQEEQIRALLEDRFPVFLHAGDHAQLPVYVWRPGGQRGERLSASAVYDFQVKPAGPGPLAVAEQPIRGSILAEPHLVGVGN